MKVKVIYNARPVFGSPKQEFEMGEMSFENALQACEAMFHGFQNVCPEPQAGDPGFYSTPLEVRSMCVRDMVEVNGETYVCCSVGFKKIDDVDGLVAWLKEEDPTFLDTKDVERFVTKK